MSKHIQICPYCGNDAKPETGKEVYPHRNDLRHKKFWVCRPCDARVGCHGNGWKAFGRMANQELRAAKMRAHAAFDPLWKEGPFTRNKAYKRLATEMGLRKQDCHIGMFDVPECEQAIAAVVKIREVQEGL